MAVEIVMPRVDMDMSSGRMGRWHAAEGARVVKGSTLFEIETDKAAMEVDAPASGVLKFVAASEGDVLPVGACIGWIVAEGESFAPPKALPMPGRDGVEGRADDQPAAGPGEICRECPTGRSDAPAYLRHEGEGEGAERRRRLRATPAARRLARERGLRLESVTGSGPVGRIQRRDIEARRGRARGKANVHRVWLQKGEGAPVVFLHGFGADLNGWRPVHRLLPEARPALAIDLPGHGLTALGEDASFKALIEAARAVLDQEKIVAAHLIGHSLGGAVAAALAQEPRLRTLSLMLIAPAGLGEAANAAFFDGFLQADTEAGLTPWLHMLVVDPAALGSALARTTLRQRRERPLVAEQRRLAEAIFGGGRQAFDIRSRLAAPQWPTKILFGMEDRITPAHRAEALSGLIAVHRFPHVGHMPHLEARREVARLIEELVGAAASA
jgi:pyruvate dehydrogenase E2 component (dihydrolipoamide acetyltransferase)